MGTYPGSCTLWLLFLLLELCVINSAKPDRAARMIIAKSATPPIAAFNDGKAENQLITSRPARKSPALKTGGIRERYGRLQSSGSIVSRYRSLSMSRTWLPQRMAA